MADSAASGSDGAAPVAPAPAAADAGAAPDVSILTALASSARVPSNSNQVYKDECMFSFTTPESEGGLYMNLQSFQVCLNRVTWCLLPACMMKLTTVTMACVCCSASRSRRSLWRWIVSAQGSACTCTRHGSALRRSQLKRRLRLRLPLTLLIRLMALLWLQRSQHPRAPRLHLRRRLEQVEALVQRSQPSQSVR